MNPEARAPKAGNNEAAALPDTPALGLFAGFGIELEYVLVDAVSLDVLPRADALLHALGGAWVGDVEAGAFGWSNELVLHVLEVKTSGPVPALADQGAGFHAELQRVRPFLERLGARFMPGGMHPWMDPRRETRLWPHEYASVYQTFDRIFDCRSHGWANLQSMHLNLPFAGEAEFARLHAAVRVLLPLMPALTASSPVLEGRVNGVLDNRLQVYRNNCVRVPSVGGAVIPEPVFTPAAYATEILDKAYRDLAPHDPEGMLCHEWVNARGAIPRFERSAIEIRILDMQECPQADIACAELIAAVLRALVEERWSSLAQQQAWSVDSLVPLLDACIHAGEAVLVADAAYLQLFGLSGRRAVRAGDVWRQLLPQLLDGPAGAESRRALEVILEHGPLARRLQRALGAHPDRGRLQNVYARLCDCLDHGELFQ